MKKIWALLLILLLILVCSACSKKKEEEKAAAPETAAAEASEAIPAKTTMDELAGVFSDGKTAHLVPVTPDAMAGRGIDELLTQTETSSQEGRFVGLSPDGKTAVYLVITSPERTFQLCLVRDGQLIPVTYNAAAETEDPAESEKKLARSYRSLPAAEGLSWSADGRYFTYSHARLALYATSKAFSSVPVIDTVTAEMRCVDSFNDNVHKEDFGAVLLSKMSRDGEYVYYLVYGRDYRFCRCATDGGSREVLCDIPREDGLPYEFYSTSNLFETADGSWVITGQINNVAGLDKSLGLVRFTPFGGEWHAEVQLAMIPALAASRFAYSAETDTGFATLNNPNINIMNSSSSAIEGVIVAQSSASQIMNMIQLMRFRPGENGAWDVWYIQQTGDDPAAVEMVSADPFLQHIRGLKLGVTVELPEGFSAEELLRRGYLRVFNVFLSPDGRYAILYAFMTGDYIGHLYLLDPETMEVRLVDTPDGVAGRHLVAGSEIGRKFEPGIIWNADGTLAILTEKDGVQFFRLEVR